MTTTIGMRKRLVSYVAAGALAASGTLVLATAGPAHATKDDPHKVWVCKYVQKPHQNEVLKGGKNPIFVDYASLTTKKTKPTVGDTFQDAHDKSVVVQIGGEDPGVEACLPKTPPTTTPTTTTTKPPTTTTTTSTSTTTKPGKTTPATSGTTSPGGAGGGVTPGVGAPDTGGSGGTNPANGLIGSGLLLAAAGVLGAEAVRRRREATEN